MSCNHLPNVTCDWCQHLRPPATGHYMIATTNDTSVAATMHHVAKSSPIPGAPEMTWNQAAFSAGWAIGCGIRDVYNGRRRLKTHVDAVRKLMEGW